MALKLIKKAWNEDDRLLMSFFELDLDHPESGLPKLGSDVRVEALRDARLDALQKTLGEADGSEFSRRGDPFRDHSTLPTILNLASRFGYITWGVDLLRMASGSHRGPAIDFTRLLLQHAEIRFFHDRVYPLRDYLEWKCQLYFYCIPATFYERRLVGGTGIWLSKDPEVLCLLPKFPQTALSRGEQEGRIRLLAGQVLWLVRSRLCINRKIADEEDRQDLIKVLTAWRDYVTPLHFLNELVKIQQNNPYFITEEAFHILLPEGTFDLLRLPPEMRGEEGHDE